MERQNEAELFTELIDDPKFQLYLGHLQSKMHATAQLLPDKISTPKEAADYNYQRGFIAGLLLAATLPKRLATERPEHAEKQPLQ